MNAPDNKHHLAEMHAEGMQARAAGCLVADCPYAKTTAERLPALGTGPVGAAIVPLCQIATSPVPAPSLPPRPPHRLGLQP